MRKTCIGPCHDLSDGIGQVRGHELINGHAAVRDRFGELIDDRHRWGDQRFVAGAIEDHPAAALAEKGEDDRHPVTHVPLILGQGALVDVHHRRVEGQDVLLGDRAFAGRLAIGNDDLQEVRHVAAMGRQTGEPRGQECKASATIDPAKPVWPASSRVLLRHVVPFSSCDKRSLFGETSNRGGEDVPEFHRQTSNPYHAEHECEAPKEEPDQGQTRRMKEPSCRVAFARSQGPSTFISGGMTTHWVRDTLSMLEISIDKRHSQEAQVWPDEQGEHHDGGIEPEQAPSSRFSTREEARPPAPSPARRTRHRNRTARS